MSKHTPGPWTIERLGPHQNNPDLLDIAICYGKDGEHVCDTVYEEADARLIAAAPDLLEALEHVKYILDSGHGAAFACPENQRVIEDAIAKAKGD